MLQSAGSMPPTSWPSSLPAPVVNGTESWQPRVNQPSESPVDDIAQMYPQAVAASSDALAWQNVRALELRHDLSELEIPASDQHLLVVNLSATFQLDGRLGRREFGGLVGRGTVAILPASTVARAQFTGSHKHNLLLIFLRPLFVRQAVKEFDLSFDDLLLIPQIGFQCQHIRHIARSLLGELRDANLVGGLYADSLAVGLAMQLVRRYSPLKDIHVGHGGMAPHRLRKALGLIDHHLAEEEEGRVGLRSIAREVGMSYFHFSRAFKRSMGMTPTNYIAEQRIERAKRLMKETDLPMVEIARRAGFSSQSHFTTSFRRVARVTPRSFRNGI